jgi:hypothetical protein
MPRTAGLAWVVAALCAIAGGWAQCGGAKSFTVGLLLDGPNNASVSSNTYAYTSALMAISAMTLSTGDAVRIVPIIPATPCDGNASVAALTAARAANPLMLAVVRVAFAFSWIRGII